MRRGIARAGAIAVAAAICGLAAPAASSAAIPASLKSACATRDAADGSTSNGTNKLPYRFCDDGIPPVGGTQPNVGAVKAVAVPASYGGDGFSGLPPKASGAAAVPGADAAGNVALDVNLSFPDPAKHPMPASGYPLIAIMHGCCSGDKTSWQASTIQGSGISWHANNAWYAARGYVVMTYTSRGFVNGSGDGSTGQTQLDSRRFEINDFQHLAGQLADDTDLDGGPATVRIDPSRVVTTGGSYGAGFSWMTFVDPTWQSPGGKSMRLVATGPKYGWTDLVYSLVPTGTHGLNPLPATDGSDSRSPVPFPKRSIVSALFLSGQTGIPSPTNPSLPSHTTFPPEILNAFICLASLDPFESNPLCSGTFDSTLESFISDRSAYYQNDFFSRIASDPAARVPIFSAGTLTDPLFTPIEHRRMVERLKSIVPDYPVQEYYGDYNHFVQNKTKEWADVCGADRHVCRYEDYPGGNLNASPTGLLRTGPSTMLNDFIDHYVKPQGNPGEPAPERDVTAALQICPENASSEFPADEPGKRYTAATFPELAPNRLVVRAKGSQRTTNKAVPNHHALNSDPVENTATNGMRCPVEDTPPGAGVATYDSDELQRTFTMLGISRLTVPHTGVGTGGLQLNVRLYDLYPNGEQVMVDRGVRRLTTTDAKTSFNLHGNGWRFEKGHRIRLELAQDDDPFIKFSNQPSSLELSGATLEVPVREASTTIGGAPAESAQDDEDSEGGGSGGGGEGSDEEDDSASGSGAAGTSGGTLPFTGYLLVPLALLGVALLGGGLALRRRGGGET